MKFPSKPEHNNVYALNQYIWYSKKRLSFENYINIVKKNKFISEIEL